MEKTRSGFTIIEVALVLAIAGTIFLMVFIALPSLRRSQRDTSRRESVMNLISEIKNYQTNNGRGNLPGSSESIPATGKLVQKGNTGGSTTWAGFYRDFLGEKFTDPDGENYKLMIVNCGTAELDKDCPSAQLSSLYSASFPNGYKMYVVLGSTCYGDKAVATSNSRRLSVLYKLEGAGIYCDNT